MECIFLTATSYKPSLFNYKLAPFGHNSHGDNSYVTLGCLGEAPLWIMDPNLSHCLLAMAPGIDQSNRDKESQDAFDKIKEAWNQGQRILELMHVIT